MSKRAAEAGTTTAVTSSTVSVGDTADPSAKRRRTPADEKDPVKGNGSAEAPTEESEKADATKDAVGTSIVNGSVVAPATSEGTTSAEEDGKLAQANAPQGEAAPTASKDSQSSDQTKEKANGSAEPSIKDPEKPPASEGSSSCLPPPSTLTNTEKYDNPFLRHANETPLFSGGLFGSTGGSTETSSETTSSSGLFGGVLPGGGGVFGGLSMPGGGQEKSGLFHGSPISCGLFGNLGASSSSSTAADGNVEDRDDAAADEEASTLETTMNDDEEGALQDSSCRLSKLVKKETSDEQAAGEWIPSIMGKVEVNRPKAPSEGRSRILFRQNGSGRLLLNTDILAEAAYTTFRAKSVIFNGRQLDDQTQLTAYRLTFSTEECRKKFLTCVEELQKATRKSSVTSAAAEPDSVESAKEKPPPASANTEAAEAATGTK
eukprot:GHVS01029582.1.p1 GENE.GHVS01029582.1~~GHVS01029582.1.p1  ORF type:complete len:433 (+),score=78.41 GHVS01029582.1:2-1300(+)